MSKSKLLIMNCFLSIVKLIIFIDSIDPSSIFIFFFISIEGEDFVVFIIITFNIASFKSLLGVAFIVTIIFRVANFDSL